MVLKKALMKKLLGSKSLKVKVPIGEKLKEQEYKVGRGSELTPIPDLEGDKFEEKEVYPINEPFSYARIKYDNELSEYIYEVIEPKLTPKEKEIIALIMDTFQKALEYEMDKMGLKDKREYLKGAINSFITTRGLKIDSKTREKIDYYILRDFVDYGHIDALMHDDKIEDVSCDGTAVPLFVFHQE
ncbi:MAG: secretion system protein E, partial [Thermoplasmata archaeon]|nr:secretion system protein E [Thermoplasmata archaeon]